MKRQHIMARIFWETVCRHKALAAGLACLILLSIVLGVLPPLVLENIVDTLTDAHTIAFSLPLLYFALVACSGLADTVKESLITIFGQKSMHHLRTVMAEKLQRLPAQFHVTHEPGKTASLFTNDVSTIDALFTSGIVSMFTDACKVLSILCVVWVKSQGLALLLLAVTPVLFLFTRFCQERTLKAQRENQVALSETNQQIPETLQNLRTVRSTHSERFMERRYEASVEKSFRAKEKVIFFDAVYSPVVISVSAAVIAVMVTSSAGSGIFRDLFGMTAGTAVALIAYVTKIFEPLESIGMEIQNIQSAAAGAGRIRDFLQEQETSGRTTENTETENSEDAVTIHHLKFAYPGGEELYHGMDLTIRKGDSITLTGRTGSGKSTLLKLILGICDADEGEIRIFGKQSSEIGEWEKRMLYGYVEQQFHYVPGTIRDQITLYDDTISDEMVHKALCTVGLWDTVEHLPKSLDTVCDERTFSQGETQLLSIARAVAGNPKLLLLDEITANLDSATEHRVVEALENASRDRTVLSVSHRMMKNVIRIGTE